ncbi:hypothetical protein BDZ85DRAFT_19848 [Elsinoe ampelina]|uniref:Uncharacterized protein n=1 Tax=Elsinoe ampelina TaxID=302913 RepID=A0A6A6G5F7_9PEZI|nr:hypothetical protein BDZ85DRAFT_19848 [Elsinoe ampelina]
MIFMLCFFLVFEPDGESTNAGAPRLLSSDQAPETTLLYQLDDILKKRLMINGKHTIRNTRTISGRTCHGRADVEAALLLLGSCFILK